MGTISLLAQAAIAASPLYLGNLMEVGDSITAGYAAPPGYRQMLQDRLYSDGLYFMPVGCSTQYPVPPHDGFGGVGTEWVTYNQGPEGNIDTWISTQQPSYVLLMVGTNEHGRPMTQMRSEYTALLGHIFTDAPNVELVWASIPPSRPELGRGTYEADIEALVRAMCAEQRVMGRKVTYCDVFHSIVPETDLSPMPDGVHPNALGYSKIAEDFRAAVRRAALGSVTRGTLR